MPVSKTTASKPTVSKQVKLTLVKSKFGRLKNHRACVSGLGLRRMHQTVEHRDTPALRGMLNKIIHLLKVEE